MSCEYEVKPLPYLFCQKCMLNGCYPWNTCPFLLCHFLGGLHPAILVKGNEKDEVYGCASYSRVTDEMWQAHLADLKSEAKWNERARRRALDGKVLSNQLLPAESLLKRRKEITPQ